MPDIFRTWSLWDRGQTTAQYSVSRGSLDERNLPGNVDCQSLARQSHDLQILNSSNRFSTRSFSRPSIHHRNFGHNIPPGRWGGGGGGGGGGLGGYAGWNVRNFILHESCCLDAFFSLPLTPFIFKHGMVKQNAGSLGLMLGPEKRRLPALIELGRRMKRGRQHKRPARLCTQAMQRS